MMKKMPWKNGQGTTAEVAIEPPGAVFPKDEFLWRISCAEIHSANPFSVFPECDRLLLVWKGAGLTLSGRMERRLEPFVPLHFPGDEPLSCDLLDLTGGAVIDFGIVYRRERFKPRMTVAFAGIADLGGGRSDEQFLFCARGRIDAGGFTLGPGDALRIGRGSAPKISASADSVCVGLVI